MTVTLTPSRTCSTCGHAPPRVTYDIGYRKAVDHFGIWLDDFPVLKRALAAAEAAYNPVVEWETNGHTASNNCQIFRTAFGHTAAEMAVRYYSHDEDRDIRESLVEHLQSVEQALTFGKPSVVDKYVRTCGGVWHFLGRLPRESDTVSLRILRDLVLKPHVQAPDYDGVIHEWISEVSLLAHPE